MISRAVTGILGQSNRFIQKVLAYVQVGPSSHPVSSHIRLGNLLHGTCLELQVLSPVLWVDGCI